MSASANDSGRSCAISGSVEKSSALEKATPTGPDLSRPAELLRHWREKHGFDFAEMSRRTRIRDVESLEGACYAKLPPEPYLRGWVVEYARALGIVEAEALASSYLDRYRRAHASYSSP